MTDAYTAYVPACELVLQGRHVRITGGENVTISAGTQGTTREDLIVVRYTSDATTAVETVSLVVKQGASSDTDVDNSGSILDGATIADVPIAKVTITSLTPTATWLLPQLPTLKALGDSVSQLVSQFAPVTLNPTFADAGAKEYFTGGFWRVGRIVIVSFFSSIGVPAAWSDKTLVTGLPSPASGKEVWTPCVVQTSPDGARYMAYVDTDGSIKVANKSGAAGGNWIAFSLTYVAAA